MPVKILILGDVQHAFEGNSIIMHVCNLIGADLVTRPDDRWDVGFIWDPWSSNFRVYKSGQFEDFAGKYVNNSAFLSNNKTIIETAFKDVFGYSFDVDPETYSGEYVVKSNGNAAHDGKVMNAPTARIPGFVYEILIDNEVENDLVEDLRLPFIGGSMPFVYKKLRPKEKRFHNFAVQASVESVSRFFSREECEMITRFCRRIGMDFGEMDILRNRKDGRIYIVDANNTPWGPPSPLNRLEGEGRLAIEIITDHFVRFLVWPHLRSGLGRVYS